MQLQNDHSLMEDCRVARPQNYDLDEAVHKARDLFWAEGFAACDVDRIVRGTGLNRHSLYRSVGGKAGLFHKALSHYVDTVASKFIDLLSGEDGLESIISYFHAAREVLSSQSASGEGRNGCFVTNTVIEMGQSDASVNVIVRRHYAAMERGFRGALLRGQEQGSIRADIDIEKMAHWLVMTSQGMSVAARFGVADSDITKEIAEALATRTTPTPIANIQ